MRHFFLDRINLDRGYIEDPVDLHHMMKVLRMGLGEEVSVAYLGRVYRAKILSMSSSQVELGLEEEIKRPAYPEIHLYQAFAKGQKIEQILQQATELGVSKFGLFPSRYSDVKSVDKKRQRYERIIKDAAKQSKASSLPLLEIYASIKELELGEDEIFFCYEKEAQEKISLGTRGSVGIIIGPEGGFSEEEAFLLEKSSRAVSLGQRTLRTETAGLVATTIILREFGVL